MTVRRMLPCVVGMFPFACDGSTAVEGDAGARDAATLDGGSTRDAAPLDAATPDTARVDAAPTPDAGAPDPGFVHAGWCRTSDTALGRVASSLGAGECAELSVDPSLPALGLHGHLTSWSDTGVWNQPRVLLRRPVAARSAALRRGYRHMERRAHAVARQRGPHAYDGNATEHAPRH